MSELSMYLIVIIRYIMAGSYGTLFILHVNWHLTNNSCTPPFFSYIPSAYSQKNLQLYHNQKEKQINHQLIHQPPQSSLFYSIFDQLYFPFTHLYLSWFWVFVIKKIFSMYVNVYSGILSIVNFIAYTLSITCLYFSTVSLIGASCTARLFFNCGCLESSFFLSDFRLYHAVLILQLYPSLITDHCCFYDFLSTYTSTAFWNMPNTLAVPNWKHLSFEQFK